MEVELIRKSHHIDSDEPDADGMVDWYYEYDDLIVRLGSFEAFLRTYVDTPEEISFRGFRDGNVGVGLGDAKKSYRPEIATICRYLRDQGYQSVKWIGGPTGGYEEVPL